MEDITKEQKLLEILNSGEIPDAVDLAAAEEAVENAFPDMDEESRKTMARVMVSNMPTPEEIEQAEKIAQHNAEVKARRKDKLRERALRRALSGHKNKKRRRK